MNFKDKMRQQKLLFVSMLLFTLAIGILIGTILNTGVKAAKTTGVADATPLVIPSAVTLQTEFTRLAKQLEPSVVNISTDYTAKPGRANNRRGPSPGEEDDEEDGMDLFRRFFPGPGGARPNAPQRPFKREATGTGFLVDKNGYILTNWHVVERADHIRVKMPHDRTEHRAKLIGYDVETDLAVIKMETAKELTPCRVGNSDAVQVGDWAIAIGSPFGLEATVTAGIVSATGRDIGTQQFQKFIQTDAAINPGNSGGPLLNIRGEVIGINTAIATQSGGYQGIGFALPVNMAVKVYNDIIKTGRVTRGSIGVSWNREEKPETLQALGFKDGVLIGAVTPGGPADKAGLKAEDVILSMNGKTVKDGDDLVSRVAETSVGSTVTLMVDRNGQRLEKKITIEDRAEVFKDDPRFRNQRREEELKSAPDSATQAKFGINIRDLTTAERTAAKLGEADKRGVMITRVEDDSFASDIGLQDRDIILSINRQPVASIDDVRKLQSALKPGDAVAFRILRANQAQGQAKADYNSQFVAGTLPSR